MLLGCGPAPGEPGAPPLTLLDDHLNANPCGPIYRGVDGNLYCVRVDGWLLHVIPLINPAVFAGKAFHKLEMPASGLLLFKPSTGWANSDRSGLPDFEFAAGLAHEYNVPLFLDASALLAFRYPPFPPLKSLAAFSEHGRAMTKDEVECILRLPWFPSRHEQSSLRRANKKRQRE
jgi:hypothetical protein